MCVLIVSSRGILRDCTTSPINRFAALYKTDPLPAAGMIYLEYLHSGDGSSSVLVNTYRKKNYFTTLLAFTACLMTGNIMADDAHRERWKIENVI